MHAAPSVAVQFPGVPPAFTCERRRAPDGLATARSGRPALFALAVGVAFPLLVAAVVLPRLASIGQVDERVAAARPASGAPPAAVRVSPMAVSPPPALEQAARPSPTPAPAAEHAAGRQAARSDSSSARVHTYTVQPGDELRQIAAQNSVSIAIILALNEVPNPDSLSVGQTLRLPNATP